jgi:hypothetical protein
MAKHMFYDASEVLERMQHEFDEGMKALDWLESEARATLDRLTAMQFHTANSSVPAAAGYVILPSAVDHAAADQLAQELAGGKPNKPLT